MMQHATIHGSLELHANRIANFVDEECPQLSVAIKGLIEAAVRVCDEKNINPRRLKPRTYVTHDGDIRIDLGITR